MIKEALPEKMPFRRTIWRGSLDEIFLVQLFSKPQQEAAKSTNRLPLENCRLPKSSKDRVIQESVTNRIPNHKRGETCSLKPIRAMMAVATISKLLSRDALAALVFDKPSKRKIISRYRKSLMKQMWEEQPFMRILKQRTFY